MQFKLFSCACKQAIADFSGGSLPGAVILGAVLTACSPGTLRESPPFSLLDTDWELVAIQSMDDAQGTLRLAAPERFTARFAANERVSFRLDCNRAMASWQSTPVAGGTSGSLVFGPVASTRALCPAPHLDERVARGLGHVRSYVLKDGHLFMSLMADGGIYEWRPRAAE